MVVEMKELIVYFCDDMISIIYQGKVIQKRLDSIKKGFIVDRISFIESFLAIMKKEKIKSKLFGDKIFVVKDVYFNASDLFYFEHIFIELGFIKVVYINIEELFHEEYTYVGIFKEYIVFYLERPVVLDLSYFKDFPRLIQYFKDFYKPYILLFGTNFNIPKIKSNCISIYYVDNYANYIVQSLLKVKKYDV